MAISAFRSMRPAPFRTICAAKDYSTNHEFTTTFPLRLSTKYSIKLTGQAHMKAEMALRSGTEGNKLICGILYI